MASLIALLADAVEREIHADALTLTRAIIEHEQRLGSLKLRIHPLGFIMLNLGQLPDLRMLRLHLWIPGFRLPQEPYWPIHDHVFSYASCVLAGSLTHITQDVLMDPNGERSIYTVSYDGPQSIMTRTNLAARIVETSSSVHQCGTTYRLRHRVFHETRVADETFTATTMIATQVEGLPPRVLGTRSGDSSYCFGRAMLNPKKVQRWLELRM